MTNEEEYIRSMFPAGQSPFRMPDGYLDNLSARVMSRIDDEKPAETAVRRIPLWRKIAVAAAIVGVLFSGTLYITHRGSSVMGEQVAVADDYEQLSADDLLDFTMADNQEIYACVTSE